MIWILFLLKLLFLLIFSYWIYKFYYFIFKHLIQSHQFVENKSYLIMLIFWDLILHIYFLTILLNLLN